MKTVDLAVIGAGPAGMSCATTVANYGLSVVLFDENAAPGGQIWRGIERSTPGMDQLLGPEYSVGHQTVDAFRNSKVDYYPNTLVWNISPDREIDFSCSGKADRLCAKTIVVATGALERPTAIPGWTLPGVTTAGALQILLKSSGIVHEDAVLVGAGPLVWLLAAQLVDADTPPRAIIETVPKGRSRDVLGHLPHAIKAWRYLFKGLKLMSKVKSAKVPVYRHASRLRIEGSERAESISFMSDGIPHHIESHHIALHHGVIPNQQMTRLIGAKHVWDAAQKCFRPQVNKDGETSVSHVYSIGDGAGINGAKSAVIEGELLAHKLAKKAQRPVENQQIERLEVELSRDRTIRPLLETLYAPPDEVMLPTDDTIVCRCEEITAGDVNKAIDQGAPGPNQVKFFLRAGMGPCQGRVCGLLISQLISARQKHAMQDVGYYRIRPPLKPIPLVELAGLTIDQDK